MVWRVWMAFVCVLVFMFDSGAQIVGDPAGPRPGPIVILDVEVSDDATLAWLNDQGFNISHYLDGHAEIYATPDERDLLVAQGYLVTELGTQPAPPPIGSQGRALGSYHLNLGVLGELLAHATNYPDLVRVISVGQSVLGRDLWAILITDNPDVEEDEPEFKYVSTMHGDEVMGVEMCLYFIDYLLSGYGVDNRITDLVDSTAIWIMPLMNPDGRIAGTRNNTNGFDLNRSFPRYPEDYTGTRFDGAPNLAGLQPEVAALMTWSMSNSFVLSANYHGGALVASYPFDAAPGVPDGGYAGSPDDAFYVDVSLKYAAENSPMFNFGTFPNGVVNGNDWFEVKGGMQDWMYRFAGNAEVTIEVSNIKTPSENQIPTFWADNQESMLVYLEAVHQGIRGVVTDSVTGEPIFASATVTGNAQPVFSDPDVGDYYKLILAGTYTLIVEAGGYQPQAIGGIAVAGSSATRVDVQLTSLTTLAAASLQDDFDSIDADGDDLITLAESALDSDTFNVIDLDGNGSISMREILIATFGVENVGVMNQVYVDAANTGTESGTSMEPFNTVREAAAFVANAGVISVSPGSYTETLILHSDMTLQIDGAGSATVGSIP